MALLEEVARRMRRDLARGSLLTTSLSLVYLLVYPIPDRLLLSAYAAKAASVHQTAAGLVRPDRPELASDSGGVVTVGYVSADLREHPVGLLFQAVPGMHDRSGFRVVCFALQAGPADDRVWSRIRAEADEVVDLSQLSLQQAVEQISLRRVDVLVDMNGYTQHGRPELFAARPARLGVSLLGFASSLQGAALDAIATDRVASPPEYAGDYTEGLAYLPGTHYLADHLRSWHTRRLASPSALPAVTKQQVGLRGGAFVLASFNQPFKVDPGVFRVWIRLLLRVPHSQLWLLKLNEGAAAEENLRREARRLGLADDGRLFFTGSADLADHVAYKSAADLMLDTQLYCALPLRGRAGGDAGGDADGGAIGASISGAADG
eukprot:CAMPEP_0172191520 /NCGR_PEP_ID=MMETSP1050-20130122/23748_1 /TAXON_ID=233186 /ORGANISM="Cryptomonas curvata, Strain CCAP979/52" /LENGTH=376 /DNA_ID=CAMNT_0012866581 /DNA_START=224 /DNA_END=1351 /DNA_ORIENTATION=-